MNAKYTLAAIALSLLGATSAFAADTPAPAAPAQQADNKPVLLASAGTAATAAGANAATTAAAAVTAAAAAKPAGRTREEVRAEAVEAVRNHRSTMSQHYDLLK